MRRGNRKTLDTMGFLEVFYTMCLQFNTLCVILVVLLCLILIFCTNVVNLKVLNLKNHNF